MPTQLLTPDFSSQLKNCVQEAHEHLRSEPRAEALFARAIRQLSAGFRSHPHFPFRLSGFTPLLANRWRGPRIFM
jgi:hypothetical protein